MQGKPRRILYHFGHYGYLFKYIVHRLVNKCTDEAVFLFERGGTSDSTVDFVVNNGYLKTIGPVITYFDSRFVNYSTRQEILDATAEFFDGELAKLSLSLDDFDEIHSSYDNHNAFDFYVFSKNREVTLWDMNGRVTSYPRRSPDPRCKEAYHKLQLDVTHHNPLVKQVVFSDDDHTETPKGTVFNLEKHLRSMDEGSKKLLLDMYGIPEKEFFDGKEFTMVLFCSRPYFPSRNTYEYLQMYRNLVDYARAGKENLIIKSHPRYDIDPGLISALFKGSLYLPGYVPSEIVPALPAEIAKVITSSLVSDVGEGPKIIDISNGETMHPDLFHIAYTLRGIAKEFGARFRFEMGKETGDFFKSFLYKYLKAPKNKEGPVFVVCNKTRLHALLEEDYDTVIDIDTRNDAMTYLDSPHSLWANVLEVSMDGLMPVKSYITVFSPTRSKEFSQFGLKYRMPCSDCTLTVKGVDSGSKIREIASETKVTEAAYNVLGSKIAAGIEEDEVPGLLTVWDMAMNNPGRTNVLLGNMLKSDCAGNHLFAYEICRKEKNPVTETFLGRMYRLGLTVEKDLAKAIDLLEGSLAGGPKWVPKELYDALTETGTGPALERAEEILEKYPDANTEDST